MTTAPPGDVLRQLLGRPAILEQPAICDPLGARLAKNAGYEAVALAGSAIGAHLPLGAQLFIDDITRAAHSVISVCDLPLLLDADCGWGEGASLATAVARLESAGVAAIQVSSQHIPGGANPAVERRRAHADLVRRVRVAVAARDHAMIMARSDIRSGSEYKDAVDSAEALLAAGADAILVHAPADELARLPTDLPGATLIYTGPLTASCEQSVFSPGLLERWGYSAISNKYHRCYCSRALRASLTRPAALCELSNNAHAPATTNDSHERIR